MSKQKPIEVITPPNTLKVKVGKLPALDESAIARAEAALKGLSDQFGDWMRTELDHLETAFAQVKTDGLAGRAGELLFRRMHDIKGLGTTYEFPLVTRIANSGCKLLESPELRAAAPTSLAAAHVDALKAAVRDNIRDDSHPVGRVLAEELEKRVLAFIDARG